MASTTSNPALVPLLQEISCMPGAQLGEREGGSWSQTERTLAQKGIQTEDHRILVKLLHHFRLGTWSFGSHSHLKLFYDLT